MEHVIEIDGGRIRLLALSREGIWLPFLEVEVTEKTLNTYRVPLLLKIESTYLGHLPQSKDQLVDEVLVATPQA